MDAVVDLENNVTNGTIDLGNHSYDLNDTDYALTETQASLCAVYLAIMSKWRFNLYNK